MGKSGLPTKGCGRDHKGSEEKLIAIDLAGKEETLWYRFRTNLRARLTNLYEAVASLDTFRRRTVGDDINRITNSLIESFHATLEFPSVRNDKTRAEVVAALAKAELDRANARIANTKAKENELRNKQQQQRMANSELLRRIARGELKVIEYNGQIVVIALDPEDRS